MCFLGGVGSLGNIGREMMHKEGAKGHKTKDQVGFTEAFGDVHVLDGHALHALLTVRAEVVRVVLHCHHPLRHPRAEHRPAERAGGEGGRGTNLG